ncbi:50S ribosomal protein L4 [Penicillium macrosclerotiorum]|uniref:50S ribosomal protein L4 n=1 Tax=Penicillium macrosclerotiorum TaxID=303699 RepID=UPI002548C15F|nr:50S ribosomal protein L4 [Penicillium macrosclerotiorum]KAJ5690122.1 50S ribosomal protein L4 [Penicillium macrosclerotiorum]
MMAGSETLRALRLLSRSSGGLLSGAENATRRCLVRSMATEAQANPATSPNLANSSPLAPWDTPVTVMTYTFPSMEPAQLVNYTQKQLNMPIRKDILHRAVVYEGDMTRQGTASTKWRDEVHGSHRKLLPQKGSGRARVGDKQSPIRKGGGVAHGPHPRDFSTDLPGKIYDQAWRIALSYRFQRGELVVIDNKISLPEDSTPFLMQKILEGNGWSTKKGRSTFITEEVDDDLFWKISKLNRYATIMDRNDVDVKNLLETSRLIIERTALDRIFKAHSRDLDIKPAKARY